MGRISRAWPKLAPSRRGFCRFIHDQAALDRADNPGEDAIVPLPLSEQCRLTARLPGGTSGA